MEFPTSQTDIPTPSGDCTPVSLIKSKRLRPVDKTETHVTIQFFTPAVQGKENELIGISQKSSLSPGVFTQKSYHNTGFTPKNLQKSLLEKGEDANNR